MQPQPFDSKVILSNSQRTTQENEIVLELLTAVNDMLKLENDDDYVQQMEQKENSIQLSKYYDLKQELMELTNKIGSCYEAGNFDQASLYIEKSLSMHENADAYFHKGLISVQERNLYDAIESYTKAIIMFSVYHKAYYMRASLLFSLLDFFNLFKDPQVEICVEFIKRDLETARSLGLKESIPLLQELSDKLGVEYQPEDYLDIIKMALGENNPIFQELANKSNVKKKIVI